MKSFDKSKYQYRCFDTFLDGILVPDWAPRYHSLPKCKDGLDSMFRVFAENLVGLLGFL